MNYTLPGLRKIYIAPITGDTIDYHYSSTGKVVIDETMSFNLKEVESVGFTQSKTVDARGSYFQKQFDFVVANVADTIIEDFENQSLVILFEDNNTNYWITGHKKPYSIDKEDFKINDDNSIEFSISQIYQDKIEPIEKIWTDSDTIDFPFVDYFNVPDNFTGVTGGSIILSWTNKAYTAQYDGFSLVRTNPSNYIEEIYYSGTTLTGVTQTPDYYLGGLYQYKIALSNEGDTYLYSPTIAINAPNPNRILDLSSAVDGNDIVLSWTNRNYKVPYLTFFIERINPYGHPDGAVSFLVLNSTGATTYRDIDVGDYSDTGFLGTYSYRIAIAEFGGLNPNELSNQTTCVISSSGVPTLICNTTRTTSTALLTWTTVPTATGYKLWVQNAFSGTIDYNDSDVGNVTGYTVTLSAANGYNFYFKVKAYTGGGDGAYASFSSFALQPPAPNTPTMTSRTSTSITIDWNDVAFVGTYKVQRALDAGFTTGLFESNDVSPSNYFLSGLSSGTTYYIRVKARIYVDSPCGGQVDSAWSGTLTQATT